MAEYVRQGGDTLEGGRANVFCEVEAICRWANDFGGYYEHLVGRFED